MYDRRISAEEQAGLDAAIEAEYVGKKRRHALSVFKAGWESAAGRGRHALNPYRPDPYLGDYASSRLWRSAWDRGYKAFRAWEKPILDRYARSHIDWLKIHIDPARYEYGIECLSCAMGPNVGWKGFALGRPVEEMCIEARAAIQAKVDELTAKLTA